MTSAVPHPSVGGPWPAPRLRALQVEELFRFSGVSAAYSYFGALLTLGVLFEVSTDHTPAAAWFVAATLLAVLRGILVVAYRRRPPESDPSRYARLAIVANLFAGVLWGILGTVLFPAGPVYAQLFAVMVIICFVAGSVTAYSAVEGAHEALSIPATIPTAAFLFFMRDGMSPIGGAMALFFIFCVLYFSYKQHYIVACRLKTELENEELLARSLQSNSSLSHSNHELQNRTESERRAKREANTRADLLATHVAHTLLPIAECDRNLNVLEWNAAAENTLGYRIKEMRGQHFTSLLLPAENQLAGKPAIEKLLSENRATTIEIPLQTNRGQRIPMQLFFTPIQEVNGIAVRIAVIMARA